MKIGLFVGRFQPAHRGHLQAMLDAHHAGVEHFIIGVGSAQKERTEENPFTYTERKHIMELLLEGSPFSYEIHPIPDVGDDEQWYQYVVNKLPKFDTVISGNPRLEGIFGPQGYTIYTPNITVSIKGTNTRKAIALHDTNYLIQAGNESIIQYFKQIDAAKRLASLMPSLFQYTVLYTCILTEGNGDIRKSDSSLEYSFPPCNGLSYLSAHEQLIQHAQSIYSISIKIDDTQPIRSENLDTQKQQYTILLCFKGQITNK